MWHVYINDVDYTCNFLCIKRHDAVFLYMYMRGLKFNGAISILRGSFEERAKSSEVTIVRTESLRIARYGTVVNLDVTSTMTSQP